MNPEAGSGLRILSARSSLFEVEMDLGPWKDVESNRVEEFPDRLVAAIPSVWEHKCMMGERGGFVRELHQGTGFAHVVEHVLLELLHLADPEQRIYTGWTNPKRGPDKKTFDGIYVIHYQVTSSAQARLAAECAVEVVEDLLAKRSPRTEESLRKLKESFSWGES